MSESLDVQSEDTNESSTSHIKAPISQKQNTVGLLSIFETPFRPDLIHKAYVHLKSHSYQPQGRYPMAGMNVVADTNDPPTGRGIARIARAEGGGGSRRGEGAEVASTRGGRQAHPPTSEKRIYKKINKKESKLAFCSAIAATASIGIVTSRGHKISKYLEEYGNNLPIIIEDDISNYTTARDVMKLLESLNLTEDMDRLARRKSRSGRSSLRGRSKKIGKSVLFVTHDNNAHIHKAVGSLPGVDAKSTSQLSVLDLAPGGNPARLTIFTASAIDQVANMAKSTRLEIIKTYNEITSEAGAQ